MVAYYQLGRWMYHVVAHTAAQRARGRVMHACPQDPQSALQSMLCRHEQLNG